MKNLLLIIAILACAWLGFQNHQLKAKNSLLLERLDQTTNLLEKRIQAGSGGPQTAAPRVSPLQEETARLEALLKRKRELEASSGEREIRARKDQIRELELRLQSLPSQSPKAISSEEREAMERIDQMQSQIRILKNRARGFRKSKGDLHSAEYLDLSKQIEDLKSEVSMLREEQEKSHRVATQEAPDRASLRKQLAVLRREVEASNGALRELRQLEYRIHTQEEVIRRLEPTPGVH